MATELTKNGVSTTIEPDTFRSELCTFGGNGYPRVTRVQWDYRDKDGVLHSGIAKNLAQAREEAAKFGYRF